MDASLDTVGIWAAATEADTPAARDAATAVTASQQPAQAPALPTDSNNVASAGSDAYGKGVVFYMRDDAVVGVVLWNVFDKIPLARKIIRSQKKYEDAQELAKIFKIA